MDLLDSCRAINSPFPALVLVFVPGVAAAPPPTLPAKMVVLSLKICVRQCNVVKTMQFEPSTAIYDACRIIRERVPEAQTGQGENDLKDILQEELWMGSKV